MLAALLQRDVVEPEPSDRAAPVRWPAVAAKSIATNKPSGRAIIESWTPFMAGLVVLPVDRSRDTESGPNRPHYKSGGETPFTRRPSATAWKPARFLP